MKEVFYHELTHAAQYAALGDSWYNTFVSAEESEITFTAFNDPVAEPYGRGNHGANSAIIALGEGWAYYMGHFLADRTYGTNASCQTEQLGATSTCNFNATGHPHLDVEESFNPNLQSDPFNWIPQGLFFDLMDPANETIANFNFVNDFVSGYTTSQMFNTFQSNIYTLQDYRARLLQTTTNNTSAQVTGLFAQYNY